MLFVKCEALVCGVWHCKCGFFSLWKIFSETSIFNPWLGIVDAEGQLNVYISDCVGGGCPRPLSSRVNTVSGFRCTFCHTWSSTKICHCALSCVKGTLCISSPQLWVTFHSLLSALEPCIKFSNVCFWRFLQVLALLMTGYILDVLKRLYQSKIITMSKYFLLLQGRHRLSGAKLC